MFGLRGSNITTIKAFRFAAFLAATAGFIVYQGRQMSVNAASAGSQAEVSGARADHQSGEHAGDAAGEQAYAAHCAMCHGAHRQGNLPAIPPLLSIGRSMTEPQIADIIHTGKKIMPAFPKLQGEELTALTHFLVGDSRAATATGNGTTIVGSAQSRRSDLAIAGGPLFQQNCAFCHGRDAGGGETGPDLTRSKLVHADIGGDKISEVVRNGRPDKGMPAFTFSNQEMLTLAAFIHTEVARAEAKPGSRRGVDVADLQTGDVEAGKRYFNGAGTCSTCHSATGDLAGVASRHEGLELEERMLYPRGVKSRATVTLPSGQQVTGTVAYLDEFTIGLRDGSGTYRSWPTGAVKYAIDSPVKAHAELFSKYTDADIHNLMAYVQTLR